MRNFLLAGIILFAFASTMVGCTDDPLEVMSFQGCSNVVVVELDGTANQNGSLETSDCSAQQILSDSTYRDLYAFRLGRDRDVSVRVTAGNVENDFVLRLYNFDTGVEVASNDDCQNVITLDPCLNLELEEGDYIVAVEGFDLSELGLYTLTIETD